MSEDVRALQREVDLLRAEQTQFMKSLFGLVIGMNAAHLMSNEEIFARAEELAEACRAGAQRNVDRMHR